MKPIVLVAPFVAMLAASPALAFDTADSDTIKNFVETAYPRITSLSPMQEQEGLGTCVRYFATEDAFRKFSDALKADGSIDFVYRDGGMTIDDIISKVSVMDRGKGEWQAEFIARHRTLGPDAEKAECLAVRIVLRELPLAPGMNPVGIETITSKPSKVKCPAD
ncbi:hypothetical protein OIU34_22315 [Pararhizobium sp. BT-229]|uniref:hypothetical protein n=1 Tax=Pararhizobium sp. BT-229 TaxID=2986923 RepID=UPI0021F7D2A0|nr:hypothetical protein [Pararhizobium sp. BT-229]MCV9964629.1 hypothetical protein [Pararhizobium sp. BT-229]